MYHILPESHDNVIGIRVEGFIHAQDYETLLPFLSNFIQTYGNIRVLSDLRDFEGISFGAILKALPFAFKNSSHVEKKAVITDKTWIYTWTKILSPFFKAELRCFPSSDAEQAWEWVNK